ncbi:MAG: tyrosine-type recombinase/integrase [Gemmataceae bacterium]
MAGVRKKGDGWHLTFRFGGRRHYFALGNLAEEQARAKAAEVDETLPLIEPRAARRARTVALEEFVAAGGKVPVVSATRPEVVTARQLFDAYLATHANGTVEASSLLTSRTHLKKVVESIGERFRIQSLTLVHLQAHVDRRGKKGTSPVTLKKEIASLRACWNWAAHGGVIKGAFPGRGLRFPKEEEKEPFRTLAEVEAIVEREKPDDARKEALRESIYLSKQEVEEFLEHVRTSGTLPWVYPMAATAAYTGARRSELLRMLVSDVDLAAGMITVREKKRLKGRRSTRNAPITPRLSQVLREWLPAKPDGHHVFAQAAHVARSKKKRAAPTAVTEDEAHDHFQRTVQGSRWEALRGWHVLRHSFCSNMVASGIDQRIIDEIMGHSTEEQRRRYRHLAPKITTAAVAGVFG